MLKTPWYYIMVALAANDRHGQAIARDVLMLSDGGVRLWPAMLYGEKPYTKQTVSELQQKLLVDNPLGLYWAERT